MRVILNDQLLLTRPISHRLVLLSYPVGDASLYSGWYLMQKLKVQTVSISAVFSYKWDIRITSPPQASGIIVEEGIEGLLRVRSHRTLK